MVQAIFLGTRYSNKELSCVAKILQKSVPPPDGFELHCMLLWAVGLLKDLLEKPDNWCLVFPGVIVRLFQEFLGKQLLP